MSAAAKDWLTEDERVWFRAMAANPEQYSRMFRIIMRADEQIARLEADKAELVEALEKAQASMMEASARSNAAAREVSEAIHWTRAVLAKAKGE